MNLTNEQLLELFDNLCWNGWKAVLDKNNEIEYIPTNSHIEDGVAYIILDDYYWIDTLNEYENAEDQFMEDVLNNSDNWTFICD